MVVSAAEAAGIEPADEDTAGEDEDRKKTTLVIFEKEGPLGMTFGSEVPSGAAPVSISRVNRTGLAAQQPALRRGTCANSLRATFSSRVFLTDCLWSCGCIAGLVILSIQGDGTAKTALMTCFL